jgi:hypothetical protein
MAHQHCEECCPCCVCQAMRENPRIPEARFIPHRRPVPTLNAIFNEIQEADYRIMRTTGIVEIVRKDPE